MTGTDETMVVSSDKKNLQHTEQKAQVATQGIKNNYSLSFALEMLKQQLIFIQAHTHNLFHLMAMWVAAKMMYGIWYLLVMLLYSQIVMVTDLFTYSSITYILVIATNLLLIMIQPAKNVHFVLVPIWS